MDERTDGRPSFGAVSVLAAFGLTAAVLLAIGAKDYPNLHTILDTGMALLLVALALLLLDMGAHGRPFAKYLAISFAVTSALELVHVIVTVDWSGALAPIAEAAGFLRPATWPPAAHILPIGITGALWQMRRSSTDVLGYALAVTCIGAGLFLAFQWLPTYAPPGALGITRPELVLAPLLWVGVGALAWRRARRTA